MYTKYSDKIELNKKKLINNKNKPYLNEENSNHFLNGEDLELPTFQKNNYQSQFINKKLFTFNSKNNKNKYIFNFDRYNNEERKTKENNYYSNNSNIQENLDNRFNNDFLTENFEHMKKMNNNINNILSNMQKEISSSSKKKNEENQKKEEVELLLNFDKFNNKDIINEYNQNKNNINKLYNKIEFNNNEPKLNEFKINDHIKRNIITPKKIFIIDKNEQNQINIQGIKPQKDSMNIKTNEFPKEIENKLNLIYGNYKTKAINVDKLISDLYDYKVKYENLTLIVNSKDIERTKKEINENLSKLKKENYKLNLQKKFLINELTKSIYNTEQLRNKYKNELERFDSYLNKIKYDLKEKTVDN